MHESEEEHCSGDAKEALERRVARLEAHLRQKTDRCLATGERLELIIGHRKYEAAKVDRFQDLNRKLKDRIRTDQRAEVDGLLRERRELQVEAYRLSRVMQEKIDAAVKGEAEGICLL